MTITSTIPASGTIVATGATLTITNTIGESVDSITLNRSGTGGSNEVIWTSGSGYDTPYTGSRTVDGADETFTFRRNAGWDASPFQIDVETTSATEQLSFTLVGEGEYPPDMQPFNDPIEGSGPGNGSGGGTLDEVINADTPDNDVLVPQASPVVLRDGGEPMTVFTARTTGISSRAGAFFTSDPSLIAIWLSDSTDEAFFYARGIQLPEGADHPNTPGAGYGTYWVRSSDGAPMFTNSSGVDVDLSGSTGAVDSLAVYTPVAGETQPTAGEMGVVFSSGSDYSAITDLYMQNFDGDGVQIDAIWNALNAGDLVVIRPLNDRSVGAVLRVDSVTDVGTVIQLEVTAMNATQGGPGTTGHRIWVVASSAAGLGSGDVVGPASVTDNALARFDTTTGKLIQGSPITVSDAGSVTGMQTIGGTRTQVEEMRLENSPGAPLSSTDQVRIWSDPGEDPCRIHYVDENGDDHTIIDWAITGPEVIHADRYTAGDVTAAAVLADNAIVRGDGGAKGVQDSELLVVGTTILPSASGDDAIVAGAGASGASNAGYAALQGGTATGTGAGGAVFLNAGLSVSGVDGDVRVGEQNTANIRIGASGTNLIITDDAGSVGTNGQVLTSDGTKQTFEDTLNSTDINTLAKLNAIVSETLVDDTHTHEGTTILSTAEGGGKVLTSSAGGAATWESAGAPGAHDLGGASHTSVAEAAGRIVEADGIGGVRWADQSASSSAALLVVPAQKGSAGTITIGQAVYISGYDVGAGTIEVELADASGVGTMPAFGIAAATIGLSTTGNVIVSGELTGLDLQTFLPGDPLYVSETPGVLTDVKPISTALVQKIGIVSYQGTSPTTGILEVFGAGRSNDLPNLASDTMWVGDTNGVPAAVDISTFGQDLVDSADAAAARVTLEAVGGPASAVDNNIATFDLTTGKLIQDSTVAITAISDAQAAADAAAVTLDDAVNTATPDNDINVPVAAPVIFRDGAVAALTPVTIAKSNSETDPTTAALKVEHVFANGGIDVTYPGNGQTTRITGSGINFDGDNVAAAYEVRPLPSTVVERDGKNLNIGAGGATDSGNSDGGDLVLSAGRGQGTGTNGKVTIGASTVFTDSVEVGEATIPTSVLGDLTVTGTTTHTTKLAVDQLAPGTDTYVLKTVGTTPTWSVDSGGGGDVTAAATLVEDELVIGHLDDKGVKTTGITAASVSGHLADVTTNPHDVDLANIGAGTHSDLENATPDAGAIFASLQTGQIAALTLETVAAGDHILIEDASAANAKKRILASDLLGGGTDAAAIHDDTGSEISAITAKGTPVAGDFLIIEDSAAANAKKSITMGDIDHDALTNFVAAEHVDWAGAGAGTIHTDNYIEGGAGTDTTAIHDDTTGEINALTLKGVPVAGDMILIEDSAASFGKKKAAWPSAAAEVNDLTAAVTWDNVPNANITEGSVTQHQAALSIAASQLTGDVAVADGGTGASDAGTARTNLGIAPISGAGAPGVSTGNGRILGTIYIDTTADLGYTLADATTDANVWSTGDVSAAPTPLITEYARWTNANTIEGRTKAQTQADLDIESGVDFDPVGTDNSTDVTLANAPSYLSLTGQVLTHDPVDISSADVTGSLPLADLATGTPGGVIGYAVTTGIPTDIGVGTSGQVLTSQASGTPIWDDEANNLETTCTNIAANEIVFGASADTASYSTIAALTDEPSPTTGDVILIQTTEGLRKLDVSNFPAGGEINDLTTMSGIADDQIAVGSGAGTGAYKTLPNGAVSYATATNTVSQAALADLSDVTAKTGTGTTAVLNTSPTIFTPTIASFTNATHTHADAAGGGQLGTTALADDAVTLAKIDAHTGAVAGVLGYGAGGAPSEISSSATTGHVLKGAGTGAPPVFGQCVSDSYGTGTVTVAKLANGTDGELITWSAAGVATTVGAGASGQVLTSAGAGAVPTFQAAPKPTLSRSITIEDPGTAEDITMFFTPVAITITDIRSLTIGGTSTVNFDLYESAFATRATTTAVNGSSMLADTNGNTDTAFTNAAIAANSWVSLKTTTGGTAGATELHVTVVYTED